MAKLAADPKGLELEDFVAAHLAVRGVFIAAGVTQRDPEEILELDIVFTDYATNPVVAVPLEVKSGRWRLGDIFKFYGWTRYLDLPSGSFLCRQLPGRLSPDTVRRLCERLGIRLVHIKSLEDTTSALCELGLSDPLAEEMTSLWRFSFWAQRRLLDSLSVAIEAKSCAESAKAAKQYARLVRDAVFFETDPRSRVGLLFDAHQDHPRLAATIAHELTTGKVIFEDPPESRAFRDALYKGDHMPVQACLYLGHRARLAILKCAVDLEIAKESGSLPKQIVKIFDTEIDMNDAQLYGGFTAALEQLKQLSSFRQLPVFWQTFLWGWGGFLLEDRLEDEFKGLSAETGVPVREMEEALRAFDLLFSGAAPWFTSPKDDTRRVLKMMPAPIRGIGAFGRLGRYEKDKYSELVFGDDTARRMQIDHNISARLLDCDRPMLAR